MKIAIHHREGSFSVRWLEYCIENNLSYIIVNCYDSDILEILKNEQVTHLLWHFHHSSTYDIQISNYVFTSAELIGIKTFPNFATRWHFDDKIAQKYLFECLSLPHAKSWVFYSKNDALEFASQINFPIVAKLKRGAGSVNVKLLNNLKECHDFIYLMFDKGGMPAISIQGNLTGKIRIIKKLKNPILIMKKVANYLKKFYNERKIAVTEKGYLYFQEFLSDNSFDTRIVVVGNIAFGIRRFNRRNDFRASGSGKIDYNAKEIDKEIVKMAFDSAKKMKAQCVAFDFVYDKNKNPRIIEVCFAFSMFAYDNCEGYWDEDLNFYAKNFNPQFFMIKNLLDE